MIPERVLRSERHGQRDERGMQRGGGERRPEFGPLQGRRRRGVRQEGESVPVRLQQQFPHRLDQLSSSRRQLHFQRTGFLQRYVRYH